MSYISFIVFCKKHFVKKEDFLGILKMISIWTPLHKFIVFFSMKYFNSYRLKKFYVKKGNEFHYLLLTRQISDLLPPICVI